MTMHRTSGTSGSPAATDRSDPTDPTATALRSHVDAVLPAMALDLEATHRLGRRRARRRAAGLGAGSVVACAALVGLVVGVADRVPQGRQDVGAMAVSPVGTSAAAGAATPASATEPGAQVPLPDAFARRAAELVQRAAHPTVDPTDRSATQAYWAALDHDLTTLEDDVEKAGLPRSADGQPSVIELGVFRYARTLGDPDARAPQWVGWVDGRRTTVSLPPGTDRLRYVGPGVDGVDVDVLLPARGQGALLPVVRADGGQLLGSVLAFTDRAGHEFHLDLVTRSWID